MEDDEIAFLKTGEHFGRGLIAMSQPHGPTPRSTRRDREDTPVVIAAEEGAKGDAQYRLSLPGHDSGLNPIAIAKRNRGGGKIGNHIDALLLDPEG